MNCEELNAPITKKDIFMFQGKEYPIYSIVKLNNLGRKELKTDLECIQIYACTIDTNEPLNNTWSYITKWDLIGPQQNFIPAGFKTTHFVPDDIIEKVVMVAPLPGVMENIQNKKVAKYCHSDIVFEWIKCGFICIVALALQSWIVRLTIWLIAVWYYYLKCRKKHDIYTWASFETFETKHHITSQLVFDLYFNKENKHILTEKEKNDPYKNWTSSWCFNPVQAKLRKMEIKEDK